MAESSKPSWRRRSSGVGSAADRGTVAAGKGWQSRHVTTAQSAASSHKAKLISLGLLVIALAAYFALYVLRTPIKTPLLIATATHYSAPVPPNGFAQEDTEHLERTNPENLQAVKPPEGALTRAALQSFLDGELSKRAAGGPNKDVVLLYLSAHGVLNDQGEPCLLLADSSALDASTWLKFHEILDRVQRRPQIKFVLLLDAGRIEDAWSLGVLANGFAVQLEKVLTDAAAPNLFVLNAASAGERAWTAPEMAGSVFGHFAARGLGSAASPDDNEISLRELADYLSSHVTAWVRQNRASQQTPRLLSPQSAKQDFAIAFCSRDSAQETAPGEADRQRIADDWKSTHDSWRQLERRCQDRHLPRYEPLAMANLQQALLRMESLILAGAAYRSEFEAVQTEVRTLLETDPRARLPSDLDAFSFPLAAQLDSPAANDPSRAIIQPVPVQRVPVQLYLEKWIAQQGPPKLKEGEPPLPQLDHAGASDVAWQFVRQLSPPRRTPIREALALIDASGGRRNAKGDQIPELSDILFLRMVDRYLDRPDLASDFNDAAAGYLQQLLAARELAEQAAAPSDVRASLWIQPLVDAADLRRRHAEDTLFTDDVSSANPSQIKQLLTTDFAFRSEYELAIQRADQVTACYALRDEVWLNLPHLARWLLRSDANTRRLLLHRDGSLAATAEFLQQLAERNHELAALIDKQLSDNQPDAATLSTAVANVRAPWTALRELFVERCQELRDRAGQDKPTLREIAEAMRVPAPLLAAEERERLATKYQEILFAAAAPAETAAADAPRRTSAGGTAAATSEPDDGSQYDLLLRHPAVVFLSRQWLPLLRDVRSPIPEPPQQGESSALRFARQGAQIRRSLFELDQAAQLLENETNKRLADATETAANVRAGVSEADRLVRAASAFVSGPLRDPARRLRRVDLHLVMLWQARRTLDDFWGPPPGSPLDTDSYFVSVAASYLNAARRLEETPKTLRYQQVDLHALLTERKMAVAATRVEPQDLRNLGDMDALQQQIQISWPRGVPIPGIAALFLERAVQGGQSELIPVKDQDARSWRRKPLVIDPARPAEVVQMVPGQPLTAAQADLELTANLLFRGHVIRRPFAVRSPTAIVSVAVEPRRLARAKVTVKGEGNRRAFIVFIFDCSSSMNENGRLGKAIKGLEAVLDTLRGDEHYHIGLYAYGHRARFGANNAFVGPDGAPVLIHPDRDVELLEPLAPFTDDQCAALKKQLNRLQAVGVTPLYYAIKTALGQQDELFRLARPEDMKHIIVISDGIDYQFQERTSATEVRKTLREPRNASIRVDVVMFALKALESDPTAQRIARERGSTVQQELRDIAGLATATNGAQFSAENPDELTAELRNALKLVQYSVVPLGTEPAPKPQPRDLREDWVLQDLPSVPTQYSVRLHGISQAVEQTITVEGGEAFELQFDKSADRLVFPPYQTLQVRSPFDDLIDPVTNDRYRVLPILPRKNQRRVEFEVAVQNRDRLKFSSRPQHVWAEIQPLNDAEQTVGPRHIFYDAQFVPETPVPVVRFIVSDWPPGATQAALRMWLKFDFPPLKPNGTAQVEALKQISLDEDIPQVTFQAQIQQVGEGRRGWRLTVREEHEPGTDLFTARVQASPTADRIHHQYFVGVDAVRHEFDYAEKPAPTIRVTSRERVMQNALVVPRVVLAVKE